MQLTLKIINLEYTGEELSEEFLKGNQYVEELTILDGFNKIPEWAFRQCPNLKKVEIQGESVKKIGNGAFYGCGNLADVTLQEGLEEIGEWAFHPCKKLLRIKIPKSVKKIGNGAFWGCEALADVTLQEGLEKIGEDAFAQCANLPRIEIPNSIKRIGNNAFYGCENLQTIDIDNTETFVKTKWDTNWLGNCQAKVNYLRGNRMNDKKQNEIEDLSFLVVNAIINNSTAEETAEYLYKHNYRKQSETVKEFAEQLKKELFANCVIIKTISNPQKEDMDSEEAFKIINELAEQYGKEEK